MSRFGGIPVEQTGGGRFGGIPVDAPEEEKPGLVSRAGTAIANAWRGDAAEQAGNVSNSPAFRRQARDAFLSGPSFSGAANLGQFVIAEKIFGSDSDIANAAARLVPGSSVVKDEAGNDMVQTPDGQRFYANDPGMDAGDFQRGGAQVAAYVPAARVAQIVAKGSTLARAGVTGMLSGLTNAFGQTAAGRDDIDANEVAVTSVLGAGGEIIAPVVSKAFSAAMPLFRTRGGQQAAALKVAREAGIEQPTNAQVQSLTRALGEIDNGADPAAVLQGDEFGFLYTTGQRMAPNDPRRLLQLQREEYLRSPAAQQNAGGVISDPANIFAGLDARNAKAWDGIVERGTGGLTPAQQMGQVQADLIERRADAKRIVDEMYQGVRDRGPSFVGMDAMSQIPQRLRAAVREFRPDPDNFPATFKALKDIEGDLARFSESRVTAVSLDAIESQRRTLGTLIDAAKNNADRKAVTALKREFDSAVDDAWEAALRSGDPAQLEALKGAREARASFGRRFEPEGAAGSLIESLSTGSITPDEAIAKVMGVTQVAPPKAIPYIRAIKTAASNDPAVIQQLQAAHFANLLQDNAGRILDPGKIAANIQRAERNTGSLIRELYTPEEWQRTLRLADAASRLAQRGPDGNITGGGRGVRFIAQWLNENRTAAIVREFPFVKQTIDTIQRAVQSADAAAAVSGRVAPTPSPVVSASAASQGEEAQRALSGASANRQR